MSHSIYEATDTLYLWYLGQPEQPVLVGELNLLRVSQGVSLRYSSSWLKNGFPLSEDLPLIDHEHMPRDKRVAAGAVDDARPDRWGERVIRLLERPERLSLLEMLFFAGDDRFGALGVSVSAEAYLPRLAGPLPQLSDLDALHALVRKVLAGEQIPEAQRRLIAPGTSMGGARPKALMCIDGSEWVLKFADEGMLDEPLLEHAAMTLAARADIDVAETRLIRLARGVALAVKRFDRSGGRRLHALSANVALQAAGAELSYPELALLLRRRGQTDDGLNRRQMRELFRRLVFNILIDNTDDHEKNHALLVTDAQHYVLSPAYDVLPMGQALGYQAMGVGLDGAASEISNAVSQCRAYGLNEREALAEARQVALIVAGWQSHFVEAGVSAEAVAQVSGQIDRPFLLRQRQALLAD